ncbi:ROK family protein [Gramella sp. AN32]|uniref:ROK family protein n=1 Tax=Christiangramia antarctica TaxID=2058158 RepID=A0ABW5WZZ4_9FLAO|nr:ROK family protein [Gramella sp. AN32]MCM4155743.1 sugar kinase [Gramella sp. AN32]
MHKEEKIIGIDIGGTKVHIGIVQAGKVLKESKFSTSANASKTQILGKITRGIEQLIQPDVIGIGIGVPGLVDEKLGIVHNVQNIPNWSKVYLKDHLQSYFEKPVYITNDANIFVAGIKKYGAGKKYNNLVGITLGTGFGAGIIIDNTIYSGQYSSAGEYGGIPYLDKTLEDYCGGKFFQQKLGISGKEVMALAEKGNAKALDIFQQYGHHVGNAIKIILYSISPQAIFLGGSIAKGYKYFKEAMEESIKDFPFKVITESLVIERVHMKNTAILGSAAIFQMRLKKDELLKSFI